MQKNSLFSFEVFVNKWKLPQVLKILASNQSLYSHLKKRGNFPIFLQVFVNKWKILQVLKIRVSKNSLFSPPLQRNGEISLFSRLLEKPQASLKVDSYFYYLKNWEISHVFLAWVIGLKVLRKVLKYHKAFCLPTCFLLLVLPQNLVFLLTYRPLCFQIADF